MKKLMTKIIGLALGLTLATGVGVVAVTSYNRDSKESAQATTLKATFTPKSEWNEKTLSCTIDQATVRIASGRIDREEILVNQSSTITISVASSISPKEEKADKIDSYYISKIILRSPDGDHSLNNAINHKLKDFSIDKSGTTGTLLPSGTLTSSKSFTAEDGILYLSSIEVYYVPSSDKTLESISITGGLNNKEYYVGEEWDPTGLIVTATYTDRTTANVTSDVEWSYNPAYVNSEDIREVTITARYCEGSVVKTRSITETGIRVDYDEVTGYSKRFLKTLSTGSDAVCDPNGDTDLDELSTAWNNLASAFNNLKSSSKTSFRTGTAGTSTDLGKALGLYDYILNKYGTTNFSDFMSRDPVRSNTMGREVNLKNTDATLAIVIIIALTGTAVAAYFLIRKKKHN